MKVYTTFEDNSPEPENSDFIILQKLTNCNINLYDCCEDPFEENIIILDNASCYFPDSRVEDIRKIHNKILVIIWHHKSSSFRYNSHFIIYYQNLIEKLGFLEKNVFMITQLVNDINDIKSVLPDINVLSYDRWLHQLFERHIIPEKLRKKNTFYSNSTLKMKKFSLFCRRHNSDRLNIFSHLLTENLLQEFHYTYSNGYNEPIESIRNDIAEKYKNNHELINSWIDGIPYKVPVSPNASSIHEYDDYPFELKQYLDYSKIHISMETEPANSSFITEKTYRAIYFKKPFIMISQTGALEMLRKEGFKTFDPLIKENYDNVENYEDRKNAIYKEINRLNSLSDIELDIIVRRCQVIAEHNYNQLFVNVYRDIPDTFKFKHMFKLMSENNIWLPA